MHEETFQIRVGLSCPGGLYQRLRVVRATFFGLAQTVNASTSVWRIGCFPGVNGNGESSRLRNVSKTRIMTISSVLARQFLPETISRRGCNTSRTSPNLIKFKASEGPHGEIECTLRGVWVLATNENCEIRAAFRLVIRTCRGAQA